MSLIVLTGKTASGKDAIQRDLCDTYGYKQLMSSTDRPMRPGEHNGLEYNFKTSKEMDKMLKNNELMECRTYEVIDKSGVSHTYRYGLEKPHDIDISEGKYVTVLPPSAVKNILQNEPDNKNIQVYYLKVDDDIRKNRCINRGDFNETEWNRRLITDTHDFADETMKNIGAKEISGTLPKLVVTGLVIEQDKKEEKERQRQQIKEKSQPDKDPSLMTVKRPSRGIEMVFDKNLQIPVAINNIPEKHPKRNTIKSTREDKGFFFETAHNTYIVTPTADPNINILNGGQFENIKIYAPNPLSITDGHSFAAQIAYDPAYGDMAGKIITTSPVHGQVHQIRDTASKEYKKTVYYSDLQNMPVNGEERKHIENVRIPNDLTIIPAEYFKNCESLKRIDFPDHLLSIENNAFENCKSLTSVTIPDDIMHIGEDAFKDCTNLSNVTYPESISLDLYNALTGENNLDLLTDLEHDTDQLTDLMEDEDIGDER